MTAIDDIQKLLTAMKDRGAEMQAFDNLLSEISSALVDIVGLLDKPSPEQKDGTAEIVKAMTDGLAKLKAPTVSVNVSPTPITVKVDKASPPIVNVMPHDWKTLKVRVVKDANGFKEFVITKTP